MKENILNGFLTSHLEELGLVHVNSEVPIYDLGRRRYKPDILASEMETRFPVVIEVKTKTDKDVLEQLRGYIHKVTRDEPYVFERLASFGKRDMEYFDHLYGIVGLVISPDPPPASVSSTDTTILWSQWRQRDSQILVEPARVLCRWKSREESRRPEGMEPVQPGDVLSHSFKELRAFAGELHFRFSTVAPGVYQRPQIERGYVAYYSGFTLDKAFSGYIARQGVDQLNVEYHVKEDKHAEFLGSTEVKEIERQGYTFGRTSKALIFPIPILTSSIKDREQRENLLSGLVGLANLAYRLALAPEARTLSLDPASIRVLSFGKLLRS